MFSVECRNNYFFLWRTIEFLHNLVRQNVHPLTAATFGDWLSPRARAHYHKSQINTVRLNDSNFLIRLWWNLDYSTKGSSQSFKGKVPVFFHLRHGHSDYHTSSGVTKRLSFSNIRLDTINIIYNLTKCSNKPRVQCNNKILFGGLTTRK